MSDLITVHQEYQVVRTQYMLEFREGQYISGKDVKRALEQLPDGVRVFGIDSRDDGPNGQTTVRIMLEHEKQITPVNNLKAPAPPQENL